MATKSRSSVARKGRRKERRNVPHGHAYIKSTFNNTIVSITDPPVQCWHGHLRARLASKAPVSPPRSPRSWLLNPLHVARRNTA